MARDRLNRIEASEVALWRCSSDSVWDRRWGGPRTGPWMSSELGP